MLADTDSAWLQGRGGRRFMRWSSCCGERRMALSGHPPPSAWLFTTPRRTQVLCCKKMTHRRDTRCKQEPLLWTTWTEGAETSRAQESETYQFKILTFNIHQSQAKSMTQATFVSRGLLRPGQFIILRICAQEPAHPYGATWCSVCMSDTSAAKVSFSTVWTNFIKAHKNNFLSLVFSLQVQCAECVTVHNIWPIADGYSAILLHLPKWWRHVPVNSVTKGNFEGKLQAESVRCVCRERVFYR